MTPFEAYKTYLAITSHFKGNYDYFKYRGVVQATEASFLKRKDRYFFEKMSRHYGDNDIVGLVLSNTVKHRGKYWLSSIDAASVAFNEWRGICDGLSYFFTNQCDMIIGYLNTEGKRFGELFSCEGGCIPLIVRLSMTHNIALETVLLFDNIAPFLEKCNKKLAGDPLWDGEYTILIKYKPFLKVQDLHKYINILSTKLPDVEKGV